MVEGPGNWGNRDSSQRNAAWFSRRRRPMAMRRHPIGLSAPSIQAKGSLRQTPISLPAGKSLRCKPIRKSLPEDASTEAYFEATSFG